MGGAANRKAAIHERRKGTGIATGKLGFPRFWWGLPRFSWVALSFRAPQRDSPTAAAQRAAQRAAITVVAVVRLICRICKGSEAGAGRAELEIGDRARKERGSAVSCVRGRCVRGGRWSVGGGGWAVGSDGDGDGDV